MSSRPPDLLFKALSDPTRRTLYERLALAGELSVAQLTAPSGISQPAVSKHLALLKGAGMVLDRPEGRVTYYSAQPQALAPLAGWMSVYGVFWRERFDRLEDLLDRMDQ